MVMPSPSRLACLALLALDGALGKGAAKGNGRPERAAAMQRCSTYVSWALRVGIKEHPERFPGLSTNSTWALVQHRLHQTMPSSRCPDSSGSYSSPSLPSFTTRLGLNSSQLHAYREMRKKHATEFSSKSFKGLDTSARVRRRREMAVETLRSMSAFLNATQLAIFRNRTAAMRRPPAMHVAASLWSSIFHGRNARGEPARQGGTRTKH